MRVLVLHAHPVAESFNGALYRLICERLEARGHSVDACDLYKEGFEPCLTRQERLDYHDTDKNRLPVAEHVERLMNAEALVLSYPVWNFGMPAILKGYFDRVFLPGVSFRLENGTVKPNLQHIRRAAIVTTYGGARHRAFLMGDPPRRIAKRVLRSLIRPGAPFNYCALYDLNRADETKRAGFLQDVARVMDRF